MPTAFTFTETIVQGGCDTDVISYTNSYTAIVDGTLYPGIPGPGVYSLATGTVSSEYTFPNLIVTILTPGEPITIVSLSESHG